VPEAMPTLRVERSRLATTRPAPCLPESLAGAFLQALGWHGDKVIPVIGPGGYSQTGGVLA
jgi:hypothetical protein